MTPRCWACGRFSRIISFWGNFAWAHGGTFHRLNTVYRAAG